MISARLMLVCNVLSISGFSAIARSVMISATSETLDEEAALCFSAIARSVMISANEAFNKARVAKGFSAIARSVMISAFTGSPSPNRLPWFQCYSS